jgi:hypothetical protein
MSYSSRIEMREIADSDLDNVAGGTTGLNLHGQPGRVDDLGGVELAGHSVNVSGEVNPGSGEAALDVTAA